MRRSEREIINDKKIDEIINTCHCCRLGFIDGEQVYIVPLNFGYVKNDKERVFYFHGAKEGRKIDLIMKSNQVGFELDTNYQLQAGKTACQYSAQFSSVIGNGVISFIEDEQEKQLALQAIMHHNTNKEEWQFSKVMIDSVCVFKVIVTNISCKEHL